MAHSKDAPILNSREARLRGNPVPWIILLILAIALWGSLLIPKFSEWQQKINNNKSLELQVKSLQLTTNVKSLKLEQTEAEFNSVAGSYLVKERQWLPKKLDTGKIVKILELYALQLENLDSVYKDSKFQLTKVQFGKTQSEKIGSYSSTDFSLSFTTDKDNFKDFILFLQTGEISEKLKTGKEKGQIELIDYKFLENNILPLVHIDSIKTTLDKKNNTLSAQLKIILFSQ